MNQRIMLTKKLLKDSLTEILQTQSIYHISIRELCEKAGINRSTFYKYYGNQFDLLEEMEKDLLEATERFLSQQTDIKNTMVIEQTLKYLEENIDFVRLLINSNVDPTFANKLFSLTPIQTMLKDSFENRSDSSEYEYTTNFLIHGAYQVVCMWLNKENRESSEWMAQFLVDILIRY
ncbi:MAG: TetR/AcrR family transcriptional regulator [Lachnospiraceae bacterium]|nr:TetR/AcrR family transcriptional regulator [Lachnospiraceae bacterium]